jgi:putative transcriptional regulator
MASEQKRKALVALGNRIREVREAKQLTQSALAARMGRHRQTIFRLEWGQINPGYYFLAELSEALDIEITDLFKGLPKLN